MDSNRLMFECYGVPALDFGIDALFAYDYWRQSVEGSMRATAAETALIVRIGFDTSHVLPLIDGRLDLTHTLRLDVGTLAPACPSCPLPLADSAA